jgi:hypothetical protein
LLSPLVAAIVRSPPAAHSNERSDRVAGTPDHVVERLGDIVPLPESMG